MGARAPEIHVLASSHDLGEKMILGLFFKFCFTYKLLGFLGRDLEDIKTNKQKKPNYSSFKPVLMNTSETVTCGGI